MISYANKKFNLYILKIKQLIIPTILILFILSLIFFSTSNLEAARAGLKLWAFSIVPSLFCFFVATELLSHTFIIEYISKILTKFIKPIFNIPGEGAFALIMGILSGYPTGAKIICSFRKNNICTKAEGERMLAFTNNSGPLFIIGTVGVSMFADSRTGFLLLTTHILACLTVGVLFRFWKYNDISRKFIDVKKTSEQKKYIRLNNLGEILGQSIKSSINTLLMIGGFVVLFSVLISILKSSGTFNALFSLLGKNSTIPSYIEGTLLGLFEITNGIELLSSIPSSSISINIIICSFILGTGGLSVLLQVYSIISKSDISIKPYIIGKLLHGIISAIYTALIIYAFPFFNLNF